MDIATLIGIVFGFAMVIFGIISSGGVSAITGSFIDYPSIIITIGGSLEIGRASCRERVFTSL